MHLATPGIVRIGGSGPPCQALPCKKGIRCRNPVWTGADNSTAAPNLYIHEPVYVCIRACACMYTYVYICVCPCIWCMYTCTDTYTRKHSCIHNYTRITTCTYIGPHTHTYTHARTHTHTRKPRHTAYSTVVDKDARAMNIKSKCTHDTSTDARSDKN